MVTYCVLSKCRGQILTRKLYRVPLMCGWYIDYHFICRGTACVWMVSYDMMMLAYVFFLFNSVFINQTLTKVINVSPVLQRSKYMIEKVSK